MGVAAPAVRSPASSPWRHPAASAPPLTRALERNIRDLDRVAVASSGRIRRATRASNTAKLGNTAFARLRTRRDARSMRTPQSNFCSDTCKLTGSSTPMVSRPPAAVSTRRRSAGRRAAKTAARAAHHRPSRRLQQFMVLCGSFSGLPICMKDCASRHLTNPIMLKTVKRGNGPDSDFRSGCQ